MEEKILVTMLFIIANFGGYFYKKIREISKITWDAQNGIQRATMIMIAIITVVTPIIMLFMGVFEKFIYWYMVVDAVISSFGWLYLRKIKVI